MRRKHRSAFAPFPSATTLVRRLERLRLAREPVLRQADGKPGPGLQRPVLGKLGDDGGEDFRFPSLKVTPLHSSPKAPRFMPSAIHDLSSQCEIAAVGEGALDRQRHPWREFLTDFALEPSRAEVRAECLCTVFKRKPYVQRYCSSHLLPSIDLPSAIEHGFHGRLLPAI